MDSILPFFAATVVPNYQDCSSQAVDPGCHSIRQIPLVASVVSSHACCHHYRGGISGSASLCSHRHDGLPRFDDRSTSTSQLSRPAWCSFSLRPVHSQSACSPPHLAATQLALDSVANSLIRHAGLSPTFLLSSQAHTSGNRGVALSLPASRTNTTKNKNNQILGLLPAKN